MAKADDVIIYIKTDDSKVTGGLNSAERKINSFSAGVSKKMVAAFAGAFAVDRLVSYGREAVKLYDIQAQAEKQLLVALKGRQDVQRRLIAQAQELQGSTLYGDEETIRAQALIAAFVKEEQTIKRIIPLVQDMATAKGMDLAAAADLVSKTLGSSTNALSRYGIEVEGAVGSVDRLESLMRGLNEAFGGQASAAATEGAGAIKQLENAIGDLKEAIGELIVSGDGFSEFIQGSIAETQDWATIISDENKSGFGKWMLFLLGSKKRWREVADEIRNTKKEQEQNTETIETAASVELDAITVTARRIITYEGLKQQIKDARDALEKLDVTDKAGIRTAYEKIAALEAQKKAFEDLANPVRQTISMPAMTSKGAPQIGDNAPAALHGTGEDMEAAKNWAMRNVNEMYAEIQEEIYRLNQELNASIVHGIVAGLEAGFSGANFGGIMSALLSPLAGILEKEGEVLIMTGLGLEVFKKALSTLNGGAAIAVGGLLIGAAQAMKALGRVGSSGGGGSFAASTAGGSYGGNTYSGGASNFSIDISGEFTASGDSLKYVLDQTNYKQSRTRSN